MPKTTVPLTSERWRYIKNIRLQSRYIHISRPLITIPGTQQLMASPKGTTYRKAAQ